MKQTLRNVFHSPRFLVGFIIFSLILLTVLLYPLFVPRDPLASLGKGFLAPGTYVSVYDANTAGSYRVDLPDAAANRLESTLPVENRQTMLDYLTAMGVDVSGLSTANDDLSALIDTWNTNYSEADAKAKKYPGFATQAQRNALKRLDKSIKRQIDLHGATPHVFRHTYITTLAKAGIDLKTIQRISGHANITTTLNIYTHTREEEIQAAGAKVGKLIGS